MTTLRTRLAGVDPGLVRLRLASIAVAAMALTLAVLAALRALVDPTAPVTVLVFGAALAMVSNLAVDEPDLPRRRATTALMMLPAAASTVAGALLSPYHVPAAAVFVLVIMLAVWVRRFGPRGFALGMAAFMPYFFTQFLRTTVTQVPALLAAVVVGIGATLLLRGVVFAERPARTLRRVVTAFRAREHALIAATDELLAASVRGEIDARDLDAVHRARARLQETALQVENVLEQTTAGRVWPGLDDDTLALRMADAELALERLAVATRRLVHPPPGVAPEPADPVAVAALRAGMQYLLVAVEAGRGHGEVLAATADARGAVAGLVADTRPGRERTQRAAFAVRRVADAIHHAQRAAPARPGGRGAPGGFVPPAPPEQAPGQAPEPAPEHAPEHAPEDDVEHPEAPPPHGIALSTRQAVQVGVAATLAIIGGELLAPSRWYWAVITAFIVFAGTNSRGDLLSRGWGRVVGTVAGVLAGMGLAVLVGGDSVLALILLFVCVFLALYLVRVSPALLAFWITAVLALVYGLIGQFSVAVLVLRIEETFIGAAAAVLAAFLVLPRRTRGAFGEAVSELVDAMDQVLRDAADRLVGRRPPQPARESMRAMDDALGVLRQRARTLASPFARQRARSSYQRGLRVLITCDVYARALSRTADAVADPGWAGTLDPATARVRANLDGLRDVLVSGRRASDGGRVQVRSAEELVDEAEAYAARTGGDPHRRTTMLSAARLLRRIDQSVVNLAVDLGAAPDPDAEDQSPSTVASPGVANTRAGS